MRHDLSAAVSKHRLCLVVSLLFGAAFLVVMGPAFAVASNQQPAAVVVRVEEDWQLIASTPEPLVASPQVSSQMATDPNAAQFCNLHLNARDIPTYGAGGLQLQSWEGTNTLGSANSNSTAVMNTTNETITWTQYLRVDNSSNKVFFGISAASSATWGDFSGVEIAVPGASSTLANYSVNYSVQNSGVTFGANRVTYLGIQQVRTYYSDGTVSTDSTPRIIYPAPSSGSAASSSGVGP
jgi:hypothetical protein